MNPTTCGRDQGDERDEDARERTLIDAPSTYNLDLRVEDWDQLLRAPNRFGWMVEALVGNAPQEAGAYAGARGLVQWEPGDELPEDRIRRQRDG